MLDKVADVLNCLADYVDSVEQEKAEKQLEKKAEHIEKIAKKYQSVAGQEPSDNLLKLLLNTNTSELEKMAMLVDQKENYELGKPSTFADFSAAGNSKEAAAIADQQFLEWIVS